MRFRTLRVTWEKHQQKINIKLQSKSTMTQILEMSANNKLSLWLSWKETTEEYFLEKPENVFDNNFLGASQVGCKKKKIISYQTVNAIREKIVHNGIIWKGKLKYTNTF